MVHRVLFLSSLLISLSCRENYKLQNFNANSLYLKNVNGVVFHEGKPFSGRVYKLGITDTISITCFYRGKEHGAWKTFYDSGLLRELRYFNKGVKVDTLKRWWSNGQLQFACTFKNGEYNGALQEWNENGQLTKSMSYRNGYEEGSQKMYYDNGRIRSNYVVQHGKRIGLLGTKNCVNVSDSIFKK